jgi:CRISPR-associated protein Csh2
MRNKVYGIVGLKSRFSNWNADFDGYPKRTGGNIFASDKALKFVIRRFLEEKGERVFYSKTLGENGKPVTYQKRYEMIFGPIKIEDEENKKNKKKENENEEEKNEKAKKQKKEIFKNLLSFLDIKLFGTVAALSKLNVGIQGPVQFTHGFNLNKKTRIIRESILSQFSSGEGKDTSTIGQQILVDDADYFYSFSLNENNLRDIKMFLEEEAGIADITNEEYKKFKEACLHAVDAYNSTSKVGCSNSFALFVEGDRDLYLPVLGDLIKLENGVLDIDAVVQLIKENKDKIKKVELYYRPKYLQIKNLNEFDFDIKEF